jgi:hypothetical protein
MRIYTPSLLYWAFYFNTISIYLKMRRIVHRHRDKRFDGFEPHERATVAWRRPRLKRSPKAAATEPWQQIIQMVVVNINRARSLSFDHLRCVPTLLASKHYSNLSHTHLRYGLEANLLPLISRILTFPALFAS